MRQVEVFVNGQGQPQHLAVQHEQNPGLPVEPTYRAVCGAPTVGLAVKPMPSNDVHMGCNDCNEQFKMWKEVHS